MKFYCVYILICSDGTYYSGMTNDLDRRVAQHQNGRPGSYTYNRRPINLVWFQEFTTPKQAIQFEKQIKGWSHRKKQALVEGCWDDLVDFSKNYTEYGHPDGRDK